MKEILKKRNYLQMLSDRKSLNTYNNILSENKKIIMKRKKKEKIKIIIENFYQNF